MTRGLVTELLGEFEDGYYMIMIKVLEHTNFTDVVGQEHWARENDFELIESEG